MPAYISSDEDLATKVETCTFCMNMCRFACPVSEASKTELHTPFAKMQAFEHNLLTQKDLNIDQLDSEAQMQLPYMCINCGLCQSNCKHENDVQGSLSYLRYRLFSAKKVPPNVAQAISQTQDQLNTLYQNTTELIARKFNDKDRMALAEAKAQQFFYIPDYEALKEKPRQAVKILRLLQKKWPNIKVLSEALPMPFITYQLGDFAAAVSEIRPVYEATQRKVSFVFENEFMAYAYSALGASLSNEFSLPSEVYFLHNEIIVDLPRRAYQFQPASVSNRLMPQPYLNSIAERPEHVQANPGEKRQAPVPYSLFFQNLHADLHTTMMVNKVNELLDQPGDIICSNYSEYTALKAAMKSSRRKLYYYFDFL